MRKWSYVGETLALGKCENSFKDFHCMLVILAWPWQARSRWICPECLPSFPQVAQVLLGEPEIMCPRCKFKKILFYMLFSYNLKLDRLMVLFLHSHRVHLLLDSQCLCCPLKTLTYFFVQFFISKMSIWLLPSSISSLIMLISLPALCVFHLFQSCLQLFLEVLLWLPLWNLCHIMPVLLFLILADTKKNLCVH